MLNRFSLAFLMLGLAIGSCAVRMAASSVWMLSLFYPSLTFLVLGVAYAGFGPRLLGKKLDGRRRWWAIAWSLPYSLLNEHLWLVVRDRREPALGLVAENLYCGRRLTQREQSLLDGIPLQGCLDLTAEFTEAQFLRSVPHYRCSPILDGTAPTVAQLQELIDWLTSMTKTGPVYVHCALGHGRTATIVVAYLVSQGLEPDIEAGLSRMRETRPGVDINPIQRQFLNVFLS